eukprot:scaffold52783_cov50-Prasinocladus_malaysianus.AAC.1
MRSPTAFLSILAIATLLVLEEFADGVGVGVKPGARLNRNFLEPAEVVGVPLDRTSTGTTPNETHPSCGERFVATGIVH